MMNQKAQEIGCENTYFITPNGLDDQNEQEYTGQRRGSGKDHEVLYHAVPKREEFLAITQTASYTFWNMEETVIYNCYNHNAFLSMMEGALSGKTGFTADAGYCYVGAL